MRKMRISTVPWKSIAAATHPLSMSTMELDVLSSRPLRHSRVSAVARLISSSSTQSPRLRACTRLPWKQGRFRMSMGTDYKPELVSDTLKPLSGQMEIITIKLPIPRTKQYHNSPFYLGAKMWNTLPSNLRNAVNLQEFMKNLKSLYDSQQSA